MLKPVRNDKNPILKPNRENPWESKGSFNGSIIQDKGLYHLVYRALSDFQDFRGRRLQLSTIGHAVSRDGINFEKRRQLIKPEEEWEKFGCEDPRITKLDDKYFIFYTCLSDFPYYPSAIKIGVAVFSDLEKDAEKHLVTPFNSKAMVLFPEKINGKYVTLLTVNTDMPPSRIAIAWFDKKEDIWSQAYWQTWYKNFHQYILPLQRLNSDQVEVGAVPLLTQHGWLFLYAHIQHYYEEEQRIFGIEGVLLDHDNPQKILARTEGTILAPEADYEQNGAVPGVVFPSGALLEGNSISLYYGAADTSLGQAKFSLQDMTTEMTPKSVVALKVDKPIPHPLLLPLSDHSWESKAVFNPAAFFDKDTIHLVYRAMGQDNTSVFGCARSYDGLVVVERREMPIYIPRAEFESKKHPNRNSGCEDPRITRIGDTLYMCYTAYDGTSPPRVALTSISVDNFLADNFNWSDPVLISPPGIDDKDAAIFPEKIEGKFVIIHRIQNSIVLDYANDLNFDGKSWLRSIAYIPPRGDSWDSEKIGLCTPPIKTDNGWMILYHGVSKLSHEYRVGAMLLDLKNPAIVLSRTKWPILEPEFQFEREGYVKNVVFPCGAVLRGDTLFIYYGGADSVVCVATISFSALLQYLY